MAPNTIIIILSGLVVFSYLFDLLSKKSRIPSVVLLLGLGIAIRYATVQMGLAVATDELLQVLPILGTIGLIMIVLEGALELEYDASKKKAILKSFGAALGILLLTTGAVAVVINYITHEEMSRCLLNAIPYSVISSAIAIPSVANISADKREFVVYESTFSDILGIILFNFLLHNAHPDAGALAYLGGEIILTVVVSVAACVLLIYLLGKIQHHLKFFLIIAVMVFMYAIGKHFHLSSLMMVLIFGLLLSNIDQINFDFVKKYFMYDQIQQDTHLLFLLTGETAFLLRTFFFIIFGFTMEVASVLTPTSLLLGSGILGATYLVRLLFLKTLQVELLPELFITPRGLISVLLFYSIPVEIRIAAVGEGVLFLTVLGTTLLMSVGLLLSKKHI